MNSADPRRRRLAIVATHPIQYFAPWWRALAAREDLVVQVIHLRHLDARAQGTGFGVNFRWDIPLLEGYPSVNLDAPTGWRGFVRSPRLARALHAFRPDAVLVTGWQEPLLALTTPLARLLGIPVIIRGESNDLRARSWRARSLHHVLLAFATAAVAIGRANARFLAAARGSQLPVFPGAYFVENERLLADARTHAGERDRRRAAAGIGPDTVLFTFCGKLVPFKRPDWLIEAAARLHAQGLPVGVRIAGAGELREKLESRARSLGLPVEFTGFLNQTQMWRAYVGADVFVLPSTARETWGLVVNEAMVFGLPVITSDQVGSGEDLVLEDVTGWRFSGGVDALAEAMRAAIAARARLPAMGAAARRHVLENYSMEVATRGLLQALDAVCR
jgi:glycosyltransferase involved in cell wall biosynthesis